MKYQIDTWSLLNPFILYHRMGKPKINLGVSITPPLGTFVTLAPMTNGRRLPWQLADDRMDMDKNREFIATIINRTDATIYVLKGIEIGMIKVSELRESCPSAPYQLVGRERTWQNRSTRQCQNGGCLTPSYTCSDLLKSKKAKPMPRHS